MGQVMQMTRPCEEALRSAGVTFLGFDGRKLYYLDRFAQLLTVSRSALRANRCVIVAVSGIDGDALATMWPRRSRGYRDFNATQARQDLIRYAEGRDLRLSARSAIKELQAQEMRCRRAIARLRRFAPTEEGYVTGAE